MLHTHPCFATRGLIPQVKYVKPSALDNQVELWVSHLIVPVDLIHSNAFNVPHFYLVVRFFNIKISVDYQIVQI